MGYPRHKAIHDTQILGFQLGNCKIQVGGNICTDGFWKFFGGSSKIRKKKKEKGREGKERVAHFET